MPGDFPDELHDAPCTVCDFSSDEPIASGRMDLHFVAHTDRLRTMRVRFQGEFRPDTMGDRSALEGSLISGFSAGAAAHKITVAYGARTWVLVVKLAAGDGAFPFTGRSDPKPAL